MCNRWYASFALTSLAIAGQVCAAEPAALGSASVFGEFVGSTPCGESIQMFLDVRADVESALRWQLTLEHHPQSREPTRYRLLCTYDTKAGPQGTVKETRRRSKEGLWKIGKGTKSNPASIVYELDGGLALAPVDQNILHLLDSDRSLMIGTGGWSYTLNRSDAAEKPVDPALALTVPDMSYTISPVATGDHVFGVFEGRTPYQGIARELKTERHAAGTKAKWRVTLYQDAKTHQPTTYKVEGTLFRASGAREGKWAIGQGTATDAMAVVFELAATKTQNALLLLEGDEDVLFFLDHDRKPLVGHADFSYTLNRRTAAPAAP